MFQLLHLYFTAPRFDQESYNAMYARYMAYTKNLGNDIKKTFQDSILLTMANHHPRVMPLSESILKDVSFEGIQEIYNDRFGNAGDFSFTFTGDFEMDKLNQFIETYIASLPAKTEKEEYIDNNIKAPEEDVNNHFNLEMETPKSSVYVNIHKEFKYSQEDNYYLYIISQLLSKRYMEEIREKEGGTYGVGVRPTFNDHPYDEIRISIQFDCDPEKADKLKGIALNEIEKLMGGEIVEVDLEEIKKNIIKNINERENNLGYWHGKLTKYASEGKITMLKDELEVFLLEIDSNKIIEKANQLLKDTKKVEVIMSAL
jgi:zinc protease